MFDEPGGRIEELVGIGDRLQCLPFVDAFVRVIWVLDLVPTDPQVPEASEGVAELRSDNPLDDQMATLDRGA